MSDRGISYLEVLNDYLISGIESVEQAWSTGKASRASIRKAITTLQQKNGNSAPLEAWYKARMPRRKTSILNRVAPEAGQHRIYSVQEAKAGGPFLRVPVAVVDAKKGDLLRVTFEDDTITVDWPSEEQVEAFKREQAKLKPDIPPQAQETVSAQPNGSAEPEYEPDPAFA